MTKSNDDDLLTGPVPAPDDAATSGERSHAKTFGELVDKSLVGDRLPPAMSADDRALLEVATVIRAAHGNAELSAGKRRSIVEDALRQAVGGVGSPASASGNVTPIGAARARRWAPWIVAGASALVAAVVLVLFWLRDPGAKPPVASVEPVPVQWKSRPTDPLIGPIPRERVGDASTRIDTIFADRLDGYRDRTLTGRGRKP